MHNFQPDKAIDAISSGGYFGKGIGEGTLKNRVPEAHTDYIYLSNIRRIWCCCDCFIINFILIIYLYCIPKKYT